MVEVKQQVRKKQVWKLLNEISENVVFWKMGSI